MNLDASAIAPQFQWLWIVAGIASLATGGLVVGFSSSARRGLQVAGIQGTLLSLLLLGVAPTALEEDHLRILTGAEAGKVWYHDSLVREHRLAELEGSDTGGH